VLEIKCPKCGFPVSTERKVHPRGFMFFICPDCHSNVVFYNNKTDTISSELVKKLIHSQKIRIKSSETIDLCKGKKKPLTQEDVKDLKTALDNTPTVDDFLKNF
jgi:hypothetical protein